MYAPALRIWSLANPLMFPIILLLLLPVLAAFMSTAATAAAAAVVAAAAVGSGTGAAAASVLNPIRPNQHNTDALLASTGTATAESLLHRNTHGYSTDRLPDKMVQSTSELSNMHMAGYRSSSRAQHKKRNWGHRSRRHALRHNASSDRWSQQQQQPTASQHQIDMDKSDTVGDQNWWRPPPILASIEMPPLQIPGTISSSSSSTSAQQQQAPHTTRHHHHQNYHLHKTLQPKLQQQQPDASAQPRQLLFTPSAIHESTTTTSHYPSGVQPPAKLTISPASLQTPSAPLFPMESLSSSSSSSPAVRRPMHAHHQHKHQHKSQSVGGAMPARRRYCSARDVATLAYEAPTVFEGKVRSMSADRRRNFSVTFEVLAKHKEQPQLVLPNGAFVRLQFEQRNNSGECDIYREQLRPRGYVRELEPGRVYLLFVEQQRGDIGNFSILGRPVRRTAKSLNDTLQGVSPEYAERARIDSLTVLKSPQVREGHKVRIVCRVSGQPPPKVTWFKDDRSIGRNRNKYQFVNFKKRSELIIKSAARNDSGKYECRAKNKVVRPFVSREVRVNVVLRTTTEVDRITPTTGIGMPCPLVGNEFCYNGGTCLFFSDVGELACKCPEGFTGQQCGTKNPTNQQSSCGDEHHDCSPPASSGSSRISD